MVNDKNKDVHYIFFNLEMGEEQILAKLLSIYLYETYGEIISFKEIFSRGKGVILSDDKYDLIQKCRPILELFQDRIIFHSGALNHDSYKRTLEKDLKMFGTFKEGKYYPFNSEQIVGVIIDHMNLIGAYGGNDKKTEMDTISKLSVYYRNGCKILSPIHVMQLNRNSYGQERLKQGLQEPDESDFKDSGSILEDSMIALLMFSPTKARLSSHNKYDIKTLGSNYRSLKCIKNRFGEADIAAGLGFYGNIGIFKELPKPEEIYDYERYKYPDWCLDDNKEPDNVNINTSITL